MSKASTHTYIYTCLHQHIHNGRSTATEAFPDSPITNNEHTAIETQLAKHAHTHTHRDQHTHIGWGISGEALTPTHAPTSAVSKSSKRKIPGIYMV